MAIRVQHNYGGAALGASYIAGQGRAKQRQRKYALDLMRDNQRLALRRQALFNRGGGRGGGGDVIEGRWVDPRAEYGVEDAVMINAAQKSWDRKRRLGKVSGPSPYEPYFVPRDKEAEEAEADRARILDDRRYREGLRDEDRAYEEGLALEDRRREAAARERELREAGRYPKKVELDLNAIDEKIANVKKSDHISDERRSEILAELYEQQDMLRGETLPKPSPAERARNNMIMFDPKTRETFDMDDFDPEAHPDAYGVPLDKDGDPVWDKPIMPYTAGEEAEAAKAAEESKKQEEARQKAYSNEYQKLLRDAQDTESPLYEFRDDDEELRKRAKDWVDRVMASEEWFSGSGETGDAAIEQAPGAVETTAPVGEASPVQDNQASMSDEIASQIDPTNMVGDLVEAGIPAQNANRIQQLINKYGNAPSDQWNQRDLIELQDLLDGKNMREDQPFYDSLGLEY